VREVAVNVPQVVEQLQQPALGDPHRRELRVHIAEDLLGRD